MIDPTQQAAPGQPPAQGATVCIAAQPDGSYSVYLEGGDAQNAQPAADVDEALEQARQLLGAGQSEQAAPQDDADALFGAGFDKARGIPLNRS